MSDAGDRLLSRDVHAEPLAPDGASEALATSSRALLGAAPEAGTEVGRWEAGPGSDTDTEADEVFLVLSGAGTVSFADGSRIELRPGVLVRLHAGDHTTWAVTERLRKLYLG